MIAVDLVEPRDLRRLVRERSSDTCEWPACLLPGEDTAHLRHRGMGGNPAMNRGGNVAWLCGRFGSHHHQKLDGTVPLDAADLEFLLRGTIGYGSVKHDRCAWPGCFDGVVANRQVYPGAHDSWLSRGWCVRHIDMVNVKAAVVGRKREIAGLLRLRVASVDDVLDAAGRLWPWTRDELLSTQRTAELVDDRRVLLLVLTRMEKVKRLSDLNALFRHGYEGLRKAMSEAQALLETDLAVQRAVSELVREVAEGGV